MSLSGKKIVPCGVLVVGENERATAFLTFDHLQEIVEKQGGAIQTEINSKTNLIILGDTDREKNWSTSKKARALDAGTTQADTISFSDFLDTYNLSDAAKKLCHVSSYEDKVLAGGKKKSPATPQGMARGRGNLFSHTLQSTGAKDAGRKTGFYNKFFA